jgi:hypothetical protein
VARDPSPAVRRQLNAFSELLLALTNARLADDEALHASLYQTLLERYEEEVASGRAHPSLTETVADYTEDPSESVRFYELALEQLRGFPEEPTYSVRISLAERFIEVGRRREAESLLDGARADAERAQDAFWVEWADRVRADPET